DDLTVKNAWDIIIDNIDRAHRNRTENLYLNTIKNEFITFPGRIVIPRISVKQLEYDTALPVVKDLGEYMPEYFQNHRLQAVRRPEAETHSLQFVQKLQGAVCDFLHMFKVDLRFGGDSYNIVEKGNTEFYPSYITNRIYYKSRLIPCPRELNIEKGEFASVRLMDTQYVESDQHFHTFAVFDEISTRKITKDILDRLNIDVFNISRELYPFIVYEYFTACFNVINPTQPEIASALELYEPVFIVIYSSFKDITTLAPLSDIEKKHRDSLEVVDGAPVLKKEFIERMKTYFKRYSIIRDDDLAVRGWWRIDIDK
nr:hypothetical protein [Spirochaetota bacterium]